MRKVFNFILCFIFLFIGNIYVNASKVYTLDELDDDSSIILYSGDTIEFGDYEIDYINFNKYFYIKTSYDFKNNSRDNTNKMIYIKNEFYEKYHLNSSSFSYDQLNDCTRDMYYPDDFYLCKLKFDNTKLVLPKFNDNIVIYEYNKSDYQWYHNLYFSFYPMNYYFIKCDSDSISNNDVVNCTLNANLFFPVHTANLVLISDKFNISDLKSESDDIFDEVKIRNNTIYIKNNKDINIKNKYKSPKNNYGYDDRAIPNLYNPLEITIASFKVNGSNLKSSIKDSIKVDAFNLTTKINNNIIEFNDENSEKELSYIFKNIDVNKQDKVIDENPKTGLRNNLILLLPLVILGISYIIIKRKDLFKKL